VSALRLSQGPGPAEAARKLIGFFVGRVRYGVDIMAMREIINPAEIIEMPAVPDHVLGVADHRDAVVPIIDLRTRFGLPPEDDDRRTKWLLVRCDDNEVGLRVDRVTQVIKVAESSRRAQHAVLEDTAEPWIKSVYSDDAGLVFELDITAVVGREVPLPAPGDNEGEEP